MSVFITVERIASVVNGRENSSLRLCVFAGKLAFDDLEIGVPAKPQSREAAKKT
jgi:hypothetical protein